MLHSIKRVAKNLVHEVRVYQSVVRDPRTPWLARVLIGCAVAYALSPIDLIPDFIPIVGHLDDAVIVPLLIVVGLRFVPPDVIREHRESICGRDDTGTTPCRETHG